MYSTVIFNIPPRVWASVLMSTMWMSVLGLYKVKHISFCISYLLLHNKFPPNSVVSLGDSGSECLIGYILDAVQGYGHLKDQWGLKDPLPEGLLVSLLEGGITHSNWLLPEQVTPERDQGGFNTFFD